MSAPRPPEPRIPLDQLVSPGVLKLIWAGEILLTLAILALFGTILFKIGSQISRSIRTGEKIRLLPESRPMQKATYFVAPIFYRYRQARDGWKGFFRRCVWLPLVALFGTYIFTGLRGGTVWFVFIYFGALVAGVLLVCLANYVLARDGRDITFYEDGIGNRSKGGRTRYDLYTKAKVERITFEGSTFYSIKFFGMGRDVFASPEEYGISSKKIGELMTFLREQGMLVEELKEVS